MRTLFPMIGTLPLRLFQCLELLFLGAALSAGAAGPHPSIPVPGGGNDFGVNIHFTRQKPGELAMIRAAGFRWVRMDLGWGGTERTRGEYDFKEFDLLVADLEWTGLKALFILDYGNKLYDDGLSPHTPEGRAAFAKWSAAAVKRYAGKGYLWEIWNEPNIPHFWKPTTNAADYVALALEASKAIRAAAPKEAIIGPATSTVDLKFLRTCFEGGLLEHWDAVSVHPYRQKPAGTVTNDYAKLRALIAEFAPKEKVIPILSAEWGYSAAWKNYDEASQAQMLTEMFTVNRAEKIPLSIWYDWKDDGTDPHEPEHHFGLVRHAHRKDDLVKPFEPKPAYEAAQKFLGSP